MKREPVASFGEYDVYDEPPNTNRSYRRFSIHFRGKFVGATYSKPDADACRFEHRKNTGQQPQYAGSKIVPAHRYQPPTGKYAISIQMHRTAEKNRAAKRASFFASQVSSSTKAV